MAITRYGKTKEYDIPLYANPKSVQEIWPVKTIEESGIFILNNGMFSKLFFLTDINFASVTDAEQKTIIINFSRVLNSMNCRFSYTIANEYVDEDEFNQTVLYGLCGDKKDILRKCLNTVIKDKITDAKQGLYQKLYLTLTIKSDNVSEARSTFSSIEAALRSAFIQIGVNGMAGSQIIPVDINQRMQIWYNFSNIGLKTNYKFDYRTELDKQHSWLDIVSGGSIEFYNNYFKRNGYYGKVMYVSEISKSLESDTFTSLSNINCTSYISVNNELLDVSSLKKEITRKHSSIGMSIEREKQRNRNNQDFLADASDKLLGQKEQLITLHRSIESGDDHYFNTTIMIMFLAKTKKELDKITDKVNVIATTKSCVLSECFNMQRAGINSTFMFGVQEFKRVTNLSAPCLAMFMPYKTQELNDDDGIYLGINQLSQNVIRGNRKKLENKSGLYLGMSRFGKSSFAKTEIISTAVKYPKDQIIIIDPQFEYGPLAKHESIDGSIVSFDSQKEIYVNPMDVDFTGVDYSSLQEIIGEKIDFIITLLSSCMRRDIETDEMGVINDVVEKIYSENYAMRKKMCGEDVNVTEYSVPLYMSVKESFLPFKTNLSREEQVCQFSPTLQDIYQGLLDMDTLLSKKLAAYMQIFVNGSLNLFNHRTNVDLNRDFMIFDLSKIKSNIRKTAILIMLEIVRNKIKSNFKAGNWTHIYLDEMHELLGIASVEEFVIKLWKEVGKMKGILTGITQNMTDLLNNSSNADKLAAILSNTFYFALFNQSTIDRNLLVQFLPSISPAMFNYVEGAAPGTGLLKFGMVTIPFDLRMSKECEIYKIVNTDGNNEQSASI